jgi:hypothetical protein
MQFLLLVAVMCISTITAFSEEVYLGTSKELGDCLGQQMRRVVGPGSRIISPDALDDLLEQKCGYLEEREEKEFINYVESRIGHLMTDKEKAETELAIISELLMSHTRGGLRRVAVQAYKSAITPGK